MSSPNKSLELQLQMKQNTEELQDFMRDLDNWENDIKRKDEELRGGSALPAETELPPVRNKDFKKTKKHKIKSRNKDSLNGAKKASRIKSWDYKAWDRLDVDKVLDELDKEDSTHESVSDDSISEDDGIRVDSEKALAEKEKGNIYFKKGKYDEAVECYTRGMTADPFNPVLPTNRATVFYKMKKYAVAESDCNLALALDRRHIKAYLRRGACRISLGKLEDAKEDYEKVLELDADNFDAKTELKKALATKAPPQEKVCEEPKKSPEVDEEEKARLSEEQQKQRAVSQKDLGNAYFKEGKYEAAIQCYTAGIEADATNPLLPANRAMAYLKVQKYEEAEADCSQAIALDSSYCKAFARRGTARVALGKLKEAKEDFEMVLMLESGNKQALTELERINKELYAKSTQDNISSESQKTEEVQQRIVKAIDKPLHLRSTKPLRRIVIEEVGYEMQNTDLAETVAPPVTDRVTPVTLTSPLANVTENSLKESDTTPESEARSAKIPKTEEITHTSLKNNDGVIPNREHMQSIADRPEDFSSEQRLAALSPVQSINIPPVPSNYFQLEADLRMLKCYPDMKCKYLRQIEPSVYPEIFQKSLEPDVFNQIMDILHQSFTGNEDSSVIFEILRSLSEVKRFDMAVMFMSSSEKNKVQALFDRVLNSGIEEASVRGLMKKYGL
ncbi:RNA polymerase II-associated protein 3 isoform X2 [Protopterus annectens]|uniref:RNA polymerase II-associated protein 3 isoform X2 n=1 Tax=Protopterus annectens TaxID=7888 RepID=UPI001CF974F7|nr:RNA polymerase II-associated protein 3 isoform X2 [Protopterus annectens]